MMLCDIIFPVTSLCNKVTRLKCQVIPLRINLKNKISDLDKMSFHQKKPSICQLVSCTMLRVFPCKDRPPN